MYSKLPTEVAVEMKWMAWNAAWATANSHFGKYQDSRENEDAFNKHSNQLILRSEGLNLHKSTLEDIKWFAWNAAWHAANTRKGYGADAANNRTAADEHIRRVKATGELDPNLVEQIYKMVWSAAWHAANNHSGHHNDAVDDRIAFDNAFEKISGGTVLVRIDYHVNQRQLMAETPKVVLLHRFRNRADGTMSQGAYFEEQSSRTIGFSQTTGFNIGVSAGFEFGFTSVAKGNMQVSFSAKVEDTHTLMDAKVRRLGVNWSYSVGPNAPDVDYTARYTEVRMKVPYTAYYKIGDQSYTFSGIWEGVTVGDLTTQAEDIRR
jgi:hypothetical protein